MATASVSVAGLKDIAECRQFAPQRLEILDDSVVNDGDAVRGDRMGVGLGGQAMRRPAGVPDPDPPLDRFLLQAVWARLSSLPSTRRPRSAH